MHGTRILYPIWHRYASVQCSAGHLLSAHCAISMEGTAHAQGREGIARHTVNVGDGDQPGVSGDDAAQQRQPVVLDCQRSTFVHWITTQ